MKLALVAGFKPSQLKCGPKVLLAAGKYRIVMEHVKDSVLALRHGSDITWSTITDGIVIPVTEDYPVELLVTESGTEQFINVFAERM